MIYPVTMFIGLKNGPRDALYATKLLDDAQFILPAQIVAYVVIMYLSFIHFYSVFYQRIFFANKNSLITNNIQITSIFFANKTIHNKVYK